MTIDIVSPELKKYASKRQSEYIDAVLKYGSSRKAAEHLGVNRRTVDKAIVRAKEAAVDAGVILSQCSAPRVLVFDIETAPILANMWSIWNEVRSPDFILTDWYIMTWAAKWLDDDEIMSMSLHTTRGYKAGTENDKQLIKGLHALIDQADYTITHNGDKFDLKRLNTRCLIHGISPPTPYKSIDTLKIARRMFALSSNKLSYLAEVLGLEEKKMKNSGLSLWQGCIAGDTEYWEEMLEYCKQDIRVLEGVYYKLRAWDTQHPNFAVHAPTEALVCNLCGSENVKETGKTVKTNTMAYLGYKCGECGHQMRGRTNVLTKEQKLVTLINAR